MPKPTYTILDSVLTDEYTCSLCAGMVVDREGHTRWHELLRPIIDEFIKQGDQK